MWTASFLFFKYVFCFNNALSGIYDAFTQLYTEQEGDCSVDAQCAADRCCSASSKCKPKMRKTLKLIEISSFSLNVDVLSVTFSCNGICKSLIPSGEGERCYPKNGKFYAAYLECGGDCVDGTECIRDYNRSGLYYTCRAAGSGSPSPGSTCRWSRNQLLSVVVATLCCNGNQIALPSSWWNYFPDTFPW